MFLLDWRGVGYVSSALEGVCYGRSVANLYVESIAVNVVSFDCSCEVLLAFCSLFGYVFSVLEGGCYRRSWANFSIQSIAVNAVPFRRESTGFLHLFSKV